MVCYRPFHRYVVLGWVSLLSLALLCAQGARLHIHWVDCGQTSTLDPAHVPADTEHQQHAKVHLVTQYTHRMHAGDGLSVLDLSPEGLLKKLSDAPLFLAIVALVILRLAVVSRQALPRRLEPWVKHRCHCGLSPPLRAPPTP
jgi:hypothetical protein